MARINLEDQLFADGRVLAMCSSIGNVNAFGKLVVAFRLAQTFYVQGCDIPEDVFIGSDLMDLVKFGLAEKTETGFYVKGSAEQFAWIDQKKKAGKKGGLASGKSRKTKQNASTSEAEAKQNPSTTQAPLQAEGKQRPSGAKPQSQSQSLINTYIDQIEMLYDAYPRKEGRKKGLDSFKKQITTPEKLEQVKTAVANYAKECKGKDRQYIKHFATFANCWEDYLEIEPDEKEQAIETLIAMQKKAEAEYYAQKGEVQNA